MQTLDEIARPIDDKMGRIIVKIMIQKIFRYIVEVCLDSSTVIFIKEVKTSFAQEFLMQCTHLFAGPDKHLSKVNTTTQIVVQARLLLMEKKKLNLHQIISHEIRSEVSSGASEPECKHWHSKA